MSWIEELKKRAEATLGRPHEQKESNNNILSMNKQQSQQLSFDEINKIVKELFVSRYKIPKDYEVEVFGGKIMLCGNNEIQTLGVFTYTNPECIFIEENIMKRYLGIKRDDYQVICESDISVQDECLMDIKPLESYIDTEYDELDIDIELD